MLLRGDPDCATERHTEWREGAMRVILYAILAIALLPQTVRAERQDQPPLAVAESVATCVDNYLADRTTGPSWVEVLPDGYRTAMRLEPIMADSDPPFSWVDVTWVPGVARTKDLPPDHPWAYPKGDEMYGRDHTYFVRYGGYTDEIVHFEIRRCLIFSL
jgi:hypothetical protein